MKKLSKGNKIAIISAVCLILFVTIILIVSEFNVYRADTIGSSDKAELYITLMPFSTYKSNINGEEQRGKYKQKLNPNGDFSFIFYDKDGNVAFTALSYGNILQVNKMRFNRKL